MNVFATDKKGFLDMNADMALITQLAKNKMDAAGQAGTEQDLGGAFGPQKMKIGPLEAVAWDAPMWHATVNFQEAPRTAVIIQYADHRCGIRDTLQIDSMRLTDPHNKVCVHNQLTLSSLALT